MNDRQRLAQDIHAACVCSTPVSLGAGAPPAGTFFDKYRFLTDPALLHRICLALRPFLPPETEALAGWELGGIPLVTHLASLSDLPAFLIRRQSSGYGTGQTVEGGDPAGKKITLVEDLVTTGAGILKSCEELHSLGAELVAVLAVIDRQAGANRSAGAREFTCRALFTMEEIRSPDCKENPQNGGAR